LQGSVLLSEEVLGAPLVIKGGGKSTHPGADGSFTLADLPPGPTNIQIYLLGDTEPLVTLPGIMVEARKLVQAPRLAQVDLRGLIHGFTLEVVDGGARPLAGAVVWKLDAQGGPLLSVTTNAQGAAHLYNRTAALKVHITQSGHQNREVLLAPGRHRVVLKKKA